jgi:hypothetical protein
MRDYNESKRKGKVLYLPKEALLGNGEVEE